MNKNNEIQQDISLKGYNTFGLDIKARYFVVIRSMQALQSLLTVTQWQQASQKLILGSGSNVLFTQDHPGLVIKNDIMGVECIGEDEEYVWIKVGAGENWHAFTQYCIARNLAGVENLSLIPGTVGAAPMQNIGAYGVELKESFYALEAIDIISGSQHTFSKADCEFGYRSSIFKHDFKNQYIICNVTLRLSKKPVFHVDYGAVKEMLKYMKIDKLSIKAVSDAVIKIRQQKLPDPNTLANAGSFFKNPELSKAEFEKIQRNHPNIPYYPTQTNKIKIPAAWLIEQCGWKGKRRGNVGVHDNQAVVIVNYGESTGVEIKAFSETIQNSVNDKFSIWLQPEVNII